jgi:YfiH family protein
MLTYAPWHAIPGLRHGFLDGRETAAPRDAGLVVPRQVHGTRVVDAVPGATPEADALVTRPGAPAVGVVTADCMPVLLLDRGGRRAAAVHAGWRGAAAGILEAAVARLVAPASRAADLEAVIGPAVGGCCYEVGDDVLVAFRARTGDLTADAWRLDGPRPHLDLRAAARALLAAVGVAQVALLGPCTACDPAYRSYRRDGAGCGRQLSFVGWG